MSVRVSGSDSGAVCAAAGVSLCAELLGLLAALRSACCSLDSCSTVLAALWSSCFQEPCCRPRSVEQQLKHGLLLN
jgi:hypothetical protein